MSAPPWLTGPQRSLLAALSQDRWRTLEEAGVPLGAPMLSTLRRHGLVEYLPPGKKRMRGQWRLTLQGAECLTNTPM